MKIIELSNISKVFGKNNSKINALNNINLSIEKGDMIAIMGASGSGKSTLLNILGLIEKSTSGKYCLLSEDVANLSDNKLAEIRNENIGFVLQYFGLLDEYTIYQNVKIPLEYSNKKIKNTKSLVEDTLKMLGIDSKLNKYPYELSGGQAQRVAIARAIINIFERLNKKGKTIIIVTHDEKVAKRCKHIVNIKDGRNIE